MARLQILELPEGSGDDRPPFVLVVDEWDIDSLDTHAMLTAYWDSFGEKIGARGVLFADRTIDIPANDTTAYLSEAAQQVKPADGDERVRQVEAKLKAAFDVAAQFEAQRDEARQWARHGYEIGQKHCGWTDHGVAPDWLTQGWPPHIDSCEHLKQMAEFDEALTRVRNAPTRPEAMNAQQGHPDIWLHGYECGVLAAKAAARPRNEPTVKPTDA
jgi:hypothetical protein